MPLKVSKRSAKYIVTDPKGKVFGSHSTKAKAEAQRRAIEANRRR